MASLHTQFLKSDRHQNICMALFESLAHRKWASSVDKMLDLDTYGLLLNSLSFQAKQLAIALQSIKKN